jgi:HTH-type transcriptional regulator/antitoxin HigA
MEEMSAVLVYDEEGYRNLVADALPRVIHSEEENERYIAVLEALHDHGDLTPEQEQLAELLTLLIEDFENKHYQFDPASPREIVRELMQANGLKQTDVLDVFGSPSVASEVLSGKRDLSKMHIQRLSNRFDVSPELFFPRMPPAREGSSPKSGHRKRYTP